MFSKHIFVWCLGAHILYNVMRVTTTVYSKVCEALPSQYSFKAILIAHRFPSNLNFPAHLFNTSSQDPAIPPKSHSNFSNPTLEHTRMRYWNSLCMFQMMNSINSYFNPQSALVSGRRLTFSLSASLLRSVAIIYTCHNGWIFKAWNCCNYGLINKILHNLCRL